VPLAVALHFGDGVKADVSVFGLKSHLAPNAAVDARSGATHGAAKSNTAAVGKPTTNLRCLPGTPISSALLAGKE
jgi:hypothetical protein